MSKDFDDAPRRSNRPRDGFDPMTRSNRPRDGFDPMTIDLRNPFSTVFKIGGWIYVIPAIVGLVWGVYESDNLMSVIGVSARRAAGSFVTETQPVGESLYNGATGRGLRPGLPGQSDRNSIRPGADRGDANR